MSIKFTSDDKYIYLIYVPENDREWIIDRLKESKNKESTSGLSQYPDHLWLKKIFILDYDNFVDKDLLALSEKETFQKPIEDSDESESSNVTLMDKDYEFPFIVGEKVENLYSIYKDVLDIGYDLYLSTDIKLNIALFGKNGLSIFKEIGKLYQNSKMIVTKEPNITDRDDIIDEESIRNLIKNIPGSYEISLYKQTIIAKHIDRFLSLKDATKKYEQYMAKKFMSSIQEVVLDKDIVINDIKKYEYLKARLESMLKDQNKYIERDWQQEILAVFKFVYPQYVHVDEKLPLESVTSDKMLETDLVLIDSDGNIDLIEIKKPDEKIQYEREYRNNFIPTKNLIGTCLQMQNYLICLANTKPLILEEFRTKRNINISLHLKAHSPKGYIIFGRDTDMLNVEKRKADFYTTRRMFSNIIDIITYDDLIKRIDNLIINLKNSLGTS